MVGILQGETLMREEADLVILKESADAMSCLSDSKGHVGTCIHRSARIVEAPGTHHVGRVNRKLGRAPHSRRIKLCFKLPIMTERRVVLRTRRPGRHAQHEADNQAEEPARAGCHRTALEQ